MNRNPLLSPLKRKSKSPLRHKEGVSSAHGFNSNEEDWHAKNPDVESTGSTSTFSVSVKAGDFGNLRAGEYYKDEKGWYKPSEYSYGQLAGEEGKFYIDSKYKGKIKFLENQLNVAKTKSEELNEKTSEYGKALYNQSVVISKQLQKHLLTTPKNVEHTEESYVEKKKKNFPNHVVSLSNGYIFDTENDNTSSVYFTDEDEGIGMIPSGSTIASKRVGDKYVQDGEKLKDNIYFDLSTGNILNTGDINPLTKLDLDLKDIPVDQDAALVFNTGNNDNGLYKEGDYYSPKLGFFSQNEYEEEFKNFLNYFGIKPEEIEEDEIDTYKDKFEEVYNITDDVATKQKLAKEQFIRLGDTKFEDGKIDTDITDAGKLVTTIKQSEINIPAFLLDLSGQDAAYLYSPLQGGSVPDLVDNVFDSADFSVTQKFLDEYAKEYTKWKNHPFGDLTPLNFIFDVEALGVKDGFKILEFNPNSVARRDVINKGVNNFNETFSGTGIEMDIHTDGDGIKMFQINGLENQVDDLFFETYTDVVQFLARFMNEEQVIKMNSNVRDLKVIDKKDIIEKQVKIDSETADEEVSEYYIKENPNVVELIANEIISTEEKEDPKTFSIRNIEYFDDVISDRLTLHQQKVNNPRVAKYFLKKILDGVDKDNPYTEEDFLSDIENIPVWNEDVNITEESKAEVWKVLKSAEKNYINTFGNLKEEVVDNKVKTIVEERTASGSDNPVIYSNLTKEHYIVVNGGK